MIEFKRSDPFMFALSFGTFGCNFRCPGCQNWDIAHHKIKETSNFKYVSPEESIQLALEKK